MIRNNAPWSDATPAPLDGWADAPARGTAVPNPARSAWIVLWCSFIAFCLLAVALAQLLSAYITSATVSLPATGKVITGTISVKPLRQLQWVSVLEQTPLREGDRLRTDDVSRSFVTLFDYSTVLIYPSTEIELTKSDTTRFEPQRNHIALDLVRGTIHVGVAPIVAGGKGKMVQVHTPHARLTLEDGSYTVAVSANQTQVWVTERGAALVTAAAGEQSVIAGQRLDVDAQGGFHPMREPENLIRNGDFNGGLEEWQTGNEVGFQEGTDVVGTHELALTDGRLAVRFLREGSKNTHNETYIFQELDEDISVYSELHLGLETRLAHQSLSGGGYVGTEYPLLVKLRFRSSTLSEFTTVYGFYYQNDANNRTDGGFLIPHNVWVKHTVPINLATMNPRPDSLISVQVSAGGWDYESLVTNLSLVGQ